MPKKRHAIRGMRFWEWRWFGEKPGDSTRSIANSSASVAFRCRVGRLKSECRWTLLLKAQYCTAGCECFAFCHSRPILPHCWSAQDFFAACAAGTSSSSGRIFGTGPSGVIECGLICLWLLV